MIEVFRTNIYCQEQANRLIEEIDKTFKGYRTNMDLTDYNNILRIVYGSAYFKYCILKTGLKPKIAWQKFYPIPEV